jgi:hypothetical protein
LCRNNLLKFGGERWSTNREVISACSISQLDKALGGGDGLLSKTIEDKFETDYKGLVLRSEEAHHFVTNAVKLLKEAPPDLKQWNTKTIKACEAKKCSTSRGKKTTKLLRPRICSVGETAWCTITGKFLFTCFERQHTCGISRTY